MFLLLMICSITIVLGVQLPSGVKLCHRSDANFQQCVAKNIGEGIKLFAKGNKELGLPQLEPLYIEQLEIKGQPGRSVTLQQKYRNIRIHGLTVSDLTKYFTIDLDKECKWETEALTPMVKMEADYEIEGQLLVFPINARGKCTITQYNILGKNVMTCEKYRKKNDIYLRITNYTMDMKPEKVEYEFENIFPGSKQISDEILKTINENSLDIFNDVKAGFEEIFSLLYLKYTNSVFSKIPLKDVFLD